MSDIPQVRRISPARSDHHEIKYKHTMIAATAGDLTGVEDESAAGFRRG